ncbi:MAG: DUF3772 domain-containing protein [Pseudomonadota bacterium]
MQSLLTRLALAVWVALCCASGAVAQDNSAPEDAVTEADVSLVLFEDEEAWTALVNRAVSAITAGRASNDALSDLRAEVVEWRSRFQDRQSLNASRIETVESQLAALGEAPAEGDEDPRVAARRAATEAQLEELRAPVLLAQSAFNQADGLIREIDLILRDRQANRFTERATSPLFPSAWIEVADEVADGVQDLRLEVSGAWSNTVRRSVAVDALPQTILYFVAALVLLLRGRFWMARLGQVITARTNRGRGVVAFLLSLGQVVLPFLGLLAFTFGLRSTGLTGPRGDQILEALPFFGLYPILAHWLAGWLLPKEPSEAPHPLGIADHASPKAHRSFVTLGYVLFVVGLLNSFMRSTAFEPETEAAVYFLPAIIVSYLLYRLGRLVRPRDETAPADGEAEVAGPRSFKAVLRALIARGLMVIAVGGLVFAAVGYVNAFELITLPAAYTLYVLGALVLLQRLSLDFYILLTAQEEDSAQAALAPVLIAFLLMLLLVPVLALIWGAQWTDLTELWAQFREGFAIGETRISPSNFLFFALVFVAGYTITRLLQGALRTTVLPRTKLDVGGQNAIVAGTGYVGIFLSALIAITTAGINLTGLAVVAGALSVGIGFGLQNIVSNFVSGIILLIERPISQGDWIEVNGQMGYVRDISVRSTRIETFDRTDVIVPNADLVSGQVTNWTRGNNVGRVIVPVGVAYGTDTEKVRTILQEVAEAHPMVLLNPGPNVLFRGFGADSLDFEIRAILRDVNWVMVVHSDMNFEIDKKFREAGIEIPFAQRDIWLRNPEALKGAGDSAQPTDTPPEDDGA